MYKFIPILSFILFLLASCHEEPRTAVDYANLKDQTEIKRDSSTVIIEELPVEIDSTEYLIYIIGEPANLSYGKIYSSFSGSSTNDKSFSVINSYRSELSGNIHNVKFQKLESDTINQLTNQTIRINSINFLREIFNTSKKQYLVYSIYDRDTNSDNKLDSKDLQTLYLSKIDGTSFTKITPELQELIDWKIIKVQNRLYYRTLEDVDKNGTFDKKDKLHYFFIDFDQKELKPEEYAL